MIPDTKYDARLVSNALYILSEFVGDMGPKEAEAVADRLLDYVADCCARQARKTTGNHWLDQADRGCK